jgi:hypothetical protein
MTQGITLSEELTLPLEAVTETFVILAKRGSGKTYTAAVLAEEIIGAGHPCVIVDPVGVWWGLRAAADGVGPGLPVVIFGGDHGDVPLDEQSGDIIADAIIAERFSAVLDLSVLSKAAARRFMAAFIARLYHRNRDPLHLIVDEADAFAPQRTDAGGAVLLGAMEDLVRRGRARGIGCTLITQRPAVLNKDVLTQAEVLICLRMNGVRDVQAIDEWVRLHADEDEARDLKKSLPSLPVGTAWVWSPGWLNILEQVKIRARTTFDSSATPKVGEKRIVPKQMADVDIVALGQKITGAAEEAKANDPRELRARITRLEKDLAAAESARPEPVIERVEVPVLTDEDRAELGQLLGRINSVSQILDRIAGALTAPPSSPPTRPAAPPARRPATVEPSAPNASTRARPAERSTDAPRFGKTERTILAVLAQHGPRTHSQLALLSGYSAKASTIGVSLGKLRKAGLVAEGQPITATPEGIDWLGDDYEPLPTGEALIEYWRNKFGLTEQRVLDAMLSLYPATTTQAEIADLTGYSRTASTIGVALGRLRKVGVVDGWRISDDFAEGAGLR